MHICTRRPIAFIWAVSLSLFLPACVATGGGDEPAPSSTSQANQPTEPGGSGGGSTASGERS
ncbi:hypothetical protein, partial [Arthrobacter sp. OY3WO11]|uniref:hypothetical protein n=1 Tax=Arthrobacter sp. OY3WO11 TaxID=1835723 RepID=UPI001C12A620